MVYKINLQLGWSSYTKFENRKVKSDISYWWGREGHSKPQNTTDKYHRRKMSNSYNFVF